MFKLFTEEDKLHSAASNMVYAAMETGNFDRARSLLVEYEETHPDHAAALRHAITKDYGTSL